MHISDGVTWSYSLADGSTKFADVYPIGPTINYYILSAEYAVARIGVVVVVALVGLSKVVTLGWTRNAHYSLVGHQYRPSSGQRISCYRGQVAAGLSTYIYLSVYLSMQNVLK